MRAALVLALLVGCAPPPASRPSAPATPGTPGGPENLRALVGTRDSHEPVIVALAWTQARIPADDGPSLVAWAESSGALLPAASPPRPGDLLVFDRAVNDAPADLVALTLDTDARGVTEFLYAAGGVIRRGFVSTAQPSKKRDERGAVLNTFMRHGKRTPPKGTHYLAGELLAHVIRVH